MTSDAVNSLDKEVLFLCNLDIHWIINLITYAATCNNLLSLLKPSRVITLVKFTVSKQGECATNLYYQHKLGQRQLHIITTRFNISQLSP